MPTIDVTTECSVYDSFRVRQVAGLFDVPLAEKARANFRVEVPGLDEDWQIGLIVGPSGSGKSTIARRAFGDALVTHFDWPSDKAVVDCFGDLPIKDITGLLTAVGFSSPPSWIKPYEVLSGGERFRCDLARALARSSRQLAVGSQLGHDAQPLAANCCQPTAVFDEFTSVVDRNVARIGSAAVAKAIRGGLLDALGAGLLTPPPSRPQVSGDARGLAVGGALGGGVGRPSVGDAAGSGDPRRARDGDAAGSGDPRRARARFVAVTCHYDVAEWLEPDWIVDMASQTCMRRRLRRPDIQLRVYRATTAAWRLFARHHYLSGALNPSARCFVAWWREEPVTFCATLPVWGRKRHYRISRLVTLPDYQGIGLGMRVAEAVAEIHVEEGLRFNVTASHPALIAHCRKSSKWRTVNVLKTGSKQSGGRAVVSFEYDPAKSMATRNL